MSAVEVDALRLRAITTAREIGCDGDDACVDLIHDAIVATAEIKQYDASVVANAREQLRNYQRILWAIVDDATRAGKPVRVSPAAMVAYDLSSKILIEGVDIATGDLLLWTDSPRGAPAVVSGACAHEKRAPMWMDGFNSVCVACGLHLADTPTERP